ncbi:unnamed protein product [Arabidopsis halleri]
MLNFPRVIRCFLIIFTFFFFYGPFLLFYFYEQLVFFGF